MFPDVLLAASDFNKSGHLVAGSDLLRDALLATAFRPQHDPEPSGPGSDYSEEQAGPVPG